MRLAPAFFCLLLLANRATAEIADARASVVLDGGSYSVDLLLTKGAPVHLFIANPTRRTTTAEMIWVLDEKRQRKGFVSKDSDLGKRLHVEVSAALGDARVPEGAKVILRMLDRLLTDPDVPWREVYFPERWEDEANQRPQGTPREASHSSTEPEARRP